MRKIFHLHEIIAPGSFSCDEDGDTFFSNAYKKALALYEKCGLPVLADDSGLCVPSLGGDPGVLSARYGSTSPGMVLSSGERNSYLLARMEGLTDREAFFVCSMVLLLDPHRFLSVQETVEGVITSEPRGTGGFGYDPVFFLPDLGCTMAELDEEKKNSLSHRGKAGRVLSRMLENQGDLQ